MSQLSEDLKALDKELQAGWCKGRTVISTAEGEKHCLTGAMAVVTGDGMHISLGNPARRSDRYKALYQALEAHMPPWGPTNPKKMALWAWNDHHARDIDEVRSVVAKALAIEGDL
jgi:hypothetical protein